MMSLLYLFTFFYGLLSLFIFLPVISLRVRHLEHNLLLFL